MEINPAEYKILIVDDVMSNVLLLKVLLTNEKFQIATASNGTQALQQVAKDSINVEISAFCNWYICTNTPRLAHNFIKYTGQTMFARYVHVSLL